MHCIIHGESVQSIFKQISRTEDPEEIAFLRQELKRAGLEYKSVRKTVKDCDAIINRESKPDEYIQQLQPKQKQRG